MNKTIGLVLFSGGLDSILAIKILQSQNHTIEALTFKSNFYSSEKAEATARELGVKIHVIDINNEMLKLVKNPPSGYGKNLNPCIDCHALMAETAGKFLSDNKKNDYHFSYLASGEVLGQRPFSQNRVALKSVCQLAGVEILRPLSAKLLTETEIEKKGIVKRHKLFDIEGRSRHRQMDLAKKFNIKSYPSPAGGCLLTDQEFSERLGKMLEFWPTCKQAEVELLKNGRVFWLDLSHQKKKVLILVGRNKEDNGNLVKLAKTGDFMVELRELNGPTTILRGLNSDFEKNKETSINIPTNLLFSSLGLDKKKNSEEAINIAGILTGYYATKARGKEVVVKIKNI